MAEEQKKNFATEKPDHIMLSINGDARYNMAITWRTDMSAPTGYIEYREENTDEVVKKECQSLVFKSDLDETYIHTAIASELKAGTKYYYTCGDEKNRSEEYYFTTQEENLEKFSFIAISDQQQGNAFEQDYSKVQNFLLEVFRRHPEAKFLVTAGDNTDCGQHVVQWNGALAGMKGIMEYRPLMMTLGNHDNRGFKDYQKGEGRFYAEPATFFDTQFKMAYPYNGPENWKTENYSFDYGNVHFCIMGINGPDEVGEWLKEDLNNDKTWKIGSYHFPIYNSIPEGQNFDAYPWMREGIEMCDIMLAGHEHNFSRSFPIKNDEIFAKPSQGTIHYMLSTANGGGPGSLTIHSVFHAAFYPQADDRYTPSYALFEVDGKKMKITSFNGLDGEIIDEVIIDKEKDEILPHALPPVYPRNEPRMVYKGDVIGLCATDNEPEEKDGIWFVPLSIVIGYVGGYVAKEKDKMTLGVYGKKFTFTEGSDIAVSEDGKEFKIEAPVYRGRRGLLYVPAISSSELYGYRCTYVEHNNFIFWEHTDESTPIFEQP